MPARVDGSRSKARTAAQNRGEGLLAANMAELALWFGTEEQCERHMLSLRWPRGFECPECGGRSHARVPGRREFRCASCGWQFSATSGTAIAHTHLPLSAWFRAAWLVTRDPRGASAQLVAREMGCSDKAGHAVLGRLRAAMGAEMALCRVGGRWAEVDGADVPCGNDGSAANMAGGGPTDAPVLVAVSAERAALVAVTDQTAGTAEAFCSAHVSRLCEVRTDAHPSLASALAGGWDARAVPSGARGDDPAALPAVHHVISNLKAKLEGTHHGVGAARLQGYCDEFGWAYSHRRGDPFADLLRALARWPHVGVRGAAEAARPRELARPADVADARALEAARKANARGRARLLEGARGRLVGCLAALACAKASP